MAETFQIVNKFGGYIERDDITNIAPNFLVRGSSNVLSTDGRRVGNRKGYTLYGAASTTAAGIDSSFDWESHRGFVHHFRSYDAGTPTLQFLYNDTYYTLTTTLTSSAINYTTFWSTTESQDLLLFVDGGTSIFEWSGGITTFASATTTTITKQGSTTWAEDGFFLSGTRKVKFGAVEYTYTGGEGTTTLTGVTPDPTAGGHAAGAVGFQVVRSYANKPVAAVTTTGTNIAFVDSNPDTITRAAGSFVTDGYVAGDVIVVTGRVYGTDEIRTVRVELKMPGEKLTHDEAEYHRAEPFPQTLLIAESTEDILTWFSTKKSLSKNENTFVSVVAKTSATTPTTVLSTTSKPKGKQNTRS